MRPITAAFTSLTWRSWTAWLARSCRLRTVSLPQQQFFLGYAQVWCENVTEESARLNALTDPHSPGEFRVNGVLQNLPEFRQAFSCKLGDRMVATEPCRVW